MSDAGPLVFLSCFLLLFVFPILTTYYPVLARDLYEDGKKDITCIDYSDTIIQRMKEADSNLEGIKCISLSVSVPNTFLL